MPYLPKIVILMLQSSRKFENYIFTKTSSIVVGTDFKATAIEQKVPYNLHCLQLTHTTSELEYVVYKA